MYIIHVHAFIRFTLCLHCILFARFMPYPSPILDKLNEKCVDMFTLIESTFLSLSL